MSRSKSPSKGHSRGSHHSAPHGGGGGGGSDRGDGGGGGGGGGGKLVKVAFARNQAEAELIQGLLLESDIPSVLKRSRGFDAPEFLAAGPHDVMVAEHQAHAARELLADTMVESEDEEREELDDQVRLERGGPTTETTPARLALYVGIAFVVAVVLIWIVFEIS